MANKKFSDRPTGVKPVEFDLDFWNGGQAEEHSFSAYPIVDAFVVARINKLANNNATGLDSITVVKNAMRSMLNDSDGTPLEWEPVVLPEDAQVDDAELTKWPTDDPEPALSGELDDGEEPQREAQFIAPDGTVHPLSDAPKYTALAAGSSRRRFIELMDGDNDLVIEVKTIMKAYQWLIAQAADRPTVR